MWEKCKHQAFAIRMMSTVKQSFKNLFVTDMHTIESTKGYDGFRFGFEILYGMENFQVFIFLWVANILSFYRKKANPQRRFLDYFPLKAVIVLPNPEVPKDFTTSAASSRRSGSLSFSSSV